MTSCSIAVWHHVKLRSFACSSKPPTGMQDLLTYVLWQSTPIFLREGTCTFLHVARRLPLHGTQTCACMDETAVYERAHLDYWDCRGKQGAQCDCRDTKFEDRTGRQATFVKRDAQSAYVRIVGDEAEHLGSVPIGSAGCALASQPAQVGKRNCSDTATTPQGHPQVNVQGLAALTSLWQVRFVACRSLHTTPDPNPEANQSKKCRPTASGHFSHPQVSQNILFLILLSALGVCESVGNTYIHDEGAAGSWLGVGARSERNFQGVRSGRAPPATKTRASTVLTAQRGAPSADECLSQAGLGGAALVPSASRQRAQAQPLKRPLL